MHFDLTQGETLRVGDDVRLTFVGAVAERAEFAVDGADCVETKDGSSWFVDEEVRLRPKCSPRRSCSMAARRV